MTIPVESVNELSLNESSLNTLSKNCLSLLLALAILFCWPSCSNADSDEDSLAKAKSRYKSEDYKRALKDISLYLEHHNNNNNNNNNNEALRLRGRCFLALGELDKATADLEAAVNLPGPLEEAMANQSKLNPNDDDNLDYPDWLQSLVFMYVARLNAEQGHYDRAKEFCDSAMAKSPNFPECMSLRANIMLNQNLLYESEELYRQAVSLRPHDWHMWLGYTSVLQKQIKYSQALAAIERALVLIKTPPYQEPDLDKRIELMTKTRDYLRSKTTYRKI